MKKIIKLSIENTTQIRKTEDSLCELYSHDKNNGVFEFEVINETLGNEKPYAMFKFMDSQSVWKVPGTIEDNKIKILFDTTLITQDETVVCFLNLDDEERTTDFYRFKFKVKVSEIDKLDTYAVKERYFNNSIIVDKLDVVTKKELEEALKGLTVSSVEGVLTETRADEIYAKKSEIPQPYDDTALKQRVATLEERPDNNTVYDDSDLRGRVVTLESKVDNDTVYDDTDLKRRVSELENKSDKDTVYDDSDLRGRVEALENKPDNNTVYDDTVLTNRVKALEERPTGSSYDDSDLQGRVRALEERPTTTTAYDDTDVKRRLTSLEERPDNNTVYDDTDVKNRLKTIEDNQKDYVRTEDLPAPYDDRRVNERLEALETKADNDTVYNDTDLKNRVEALENRPNNGTAYDDSDLKRRVSELEQKPDNNTVYDDTDVKERLTNLETKVDKDTVYDDSDLKRRVSELEQRPDNNTVYDDTALSGRVKALEDAPKVDVTNFATKDDVVAFNRELNNKVSSVDFEAFKTTIPASYNDSDLVKRVETLETKQDKDTVYNDEPIKERLTALESKPFDSYFTETKANEIYAKKSELPTPYNDSALVSRVTALESKTTTNQTLPANQYEIHGTGMPNGVVEAEIGTTYVDKNKTNGALKWIKTTDGGNQGWEVLIGDTGWRTLNSTSKLKVGDKTSYIKIRRVNNLVTYQFGGLMWGWFGIIRRNGPGFLKHNSSGDKGAKVLGVSGIPEGFRSESSLIGGIYSDAGKPYGIWYLGGKTDSNFIQFTFNEDIPTDRDIGDIRVSAISYLTADPWPTQLP